MLLIHGEKSSCFLTTCLFTFLFEFEVPFVIVPLILAIRKRARDPPRRAGEGGGGGMGGQRPDSRERQKSSLLLSGLMILLKLYIITITSSCVSLRLSRFEARGGSTKEALVFLRSYKLYRRFIHCIENLNTSAFTSEWVRSRCGPSLTVIKCVFFFLQIVRDAYSQCCCKMSKDDCERMQLLLRKFILFSLSLK